MTSDETNEKAKLLRKEIEPIRNELTYAKSGLEGYLSNLDYITKDITLFIRQKLTDIEPLTFDYDRINSQILALYGIDDDKEE